MQLVIMMVIVVGAMLVMGFFGKRRQQKQQEELEKTLNAMQPGCKVKTIGGIIGVIAEVCPEEKTFVVETGSEATGKSYIKFDREAVYPLEPIVLPEEPKAEEAAEVTETPAEEASETEPFEELATEEEAPVVEEATVEEATEEVEATEAKEE